MDDLIQAVTEVIRFHLATDDSGKTQQAKLRRKLEVLASTANTLQSEASDLDDLISQIASLTNCE